MIHIDPTRTLIILCIVFLSLIVAVPAWPQQRGMGDDAGLARQRLQPLTTDIVGVVEAVEQAPCALTTGRAAEGAHVILRTSDRGRVNLHLGPVAALPDLLARLKPGMAITAAALWTDQMPDNAYVARTVTVGDRTFTLRDQAFRPAWRRGPGAGQGYGMGMQGRRAGASSPGPCWW